MSGWFATLILSIVALALILAGAPLARGRVRRNRWYGFRTFATLRDDATWYRVNEQAGRSLVKLGIVLGLVAMVSLTGAGDRDRQHAFLIVGTALLLVGLLIIVLQGFRTSRRLRDQHG